MLQALTIKNYALIEALNVDFSSGFTTITGETGAGKSILLGALSLVLGKRADLSSLRSKDSKCVIEATFNIENYKLKSFFKAEDLDYESQTIIRREILPSGKSRAFVNDSPVNLSSLQELGKHLIDIHSQNETRQVVDESFQFQIIDALAKNDKLRLQYNSELKSYKELKRQLKTLQIEQNEAIKAYDYNLFLLNELKEAKLETLNIQDLEAEYETLNNVEAILEKAQEVDALIQDENLGIQSNLVQLKTIVSKLSQLSQNYASISERVESVFLEFDDVVSELETLKENLEVSPERLEIVNNHLTVLNNLFQKHTVNSVESLISIREDLDQKVITTEGLDNAIKTCQIEINNISNSLKTLGLEIRTSREVAIPILTKKLERLLSGLGMPNATFKISVSESDTFHKNGTDNLAFLFSANKGMDYNELKKAASGGELSRIMLSIKAILSQYIKLPTIMFDEIDTGVSGEIAHRMGDIMSKMSINMQVFSITHLPQIASKGVMHYKVYKETVNNTTLTNLVALDKDQRIKEIALMLGGTELHDSAIAHAKQLLQ
ncbi:DNA repair protein RecN [Aurantibacter sp.]|uniref:DNA repair protein RecN n=1 Tax=Aurantibacter sp. TaxID=2807103 RepID=UPI0035C7EE6B